MKIYSNNFESDILIFLNKLCGSYIKELLDILDYNLNFKDRLNKGFIGRLIERYILICNSKSNLCDIPFIGLEIKILSLYNNKNIINDISLISYSNRRFNFMNINFIYNILIKIRKILFVTIIKNKNVDIEYYLIGNSFIVIFESIDINNFYKELSFLNEFIINNYRCIEFYKIRNLFSKSFRLQFNFNKKRNINIFFRKKFLLDLIINNYIKL